MAQMTLEKLAEVKKRLQASKFGSYHGIQWHLVSELLRDDVPALIEALEELLGGKDHVD